MKRSIEEFNRCQYCGHLNGGPHECECDLDDMVNCCVCGEEIPFNAARLSPVSNKFYCAPCSGDDEEVEEQYVPDKWDRADVAYAEWKDNPEDR